MRTLIVLVFSLVLTAPANADISDNDDEILIALNGGQCQNHCPLPAIPCPPPCQ